MNQIAAILFFGLVVYTQVAFGQTEDLEFTTDGPKNATAQFQADLENVEKEYMDSTAAHTKSFNDRVEAIRASFLQKMEVLLKQTTQSGDLDEAIRIRDKMKSTTTSKIVKRDVGSELAEANEKIKELETLVAQFEAKTRKIDRKSISAIVGTWRWFTGSDVIVEGNGSATTSDQNTSVVKPIDGVTGKFTFSWKTGSIDTLTLSPTGNLLEGVDSNGRRVWAVKLK